LLSGGASGVTQVLGPSNDPVGKKKKVNNRGVRHAQTYVEKQAWKSIVGRSCLIAELEEEKKRRKAVWVEKEGFRNSGGGAGDG